MKIVPDQIAPGCPAASSRSAPTASAAATTASTCAGHFENRRRSHRRGRALALAREGKFDAYRAAQAVAEMEIDPERQDPAVA